MVGHTPGPVRRDLTPLSSSASGPPPRASRRRAAPAEPGEAAAVSRRVALVRRLTIRPPRTPRRGHDEPAVFKRLRMAVLVVAALGAVVLIAVGSRFVLIAGVLLFGVALSLALIWRSPNPDEPRDDGRR